MTWRVLSVRHYVKVARLMGDLAGGGAGNGAAVGGGAGSGEAGGGGGRGLHSSTF
jgi:hypothetical protein